MFDFYAIIFFLNIKYITRFREVLMYALHIFYYVDAYSVIYVYPFISVTPWKMIFCHITSAVGKQAKNLFIPFGIHNALLNTHKQYKFQKITWLLYKIYGFLLDDWHEISESTLLEIFHIKPKLIWKLLAGREILL